MTPVEQFEADYFVFAGLTPGRQADVRRALAAFQAHAGGPLETLTDVELRNFLTARVGAGLHVNTVRKELKAIKPFYKWCWQRGDRDR